MFKKLLGMTLIVLFVSACSSVEKVTDKWKTPDAPNAGLSEGERSSYILKDQDADKIKVQAKKATSKKSTSSKAKAKK